jgi:hypothetical protein
MSHPYLCPSAWISATVALQKAGFGGIIFGWMCYFYFLSHGKSRHQNHRSREQSGFRVHRDEEALMCRFVASQEKSRRGNVAGRGGDVVFKLF